MGINFPSSPSSGQKFNSGKTQYTFSNGVWRASVATALPFNYFINPSFQVSQENGNAALTATTLYAADQWIEVNATAMTHSASRVAVPTPRGSPYRLRFTNTSAGTPAAGSNANLQQPFEGARTLDFRWGTAAAKQIVIRFGFKGPAGTYSIALRNGDVTRSYVANFTISAGQANTDTEQVFVIPGDMTGTWPTDNTRGLVFTVQIVSYNNTPTGGIWVAGNFQGTPSNTNVFAVANNVFELFDVGMYLDPDLTGLPPPWEYVSDRQATFDCQRYWQRCNAALGIAANGVLNHQRPSYPNQAVMRAAPTAALIGTMRAWDQITAPNITAIANLYSNQFVYEFNFNSAAQTLGRGAMLLDTNNSTIYIAHSARP